jgi:2-methylcitrate dehydratase PrpD
MPSTTVDFCARLLEAAARPLPPEVDRAARRSLLNVLGTGVSAASSDAVTVLLTVAGEAGGDGDVTVPGLARTLDPYWAALAIGTAAHLDDFDDTHLTTVIHPGAATLATVLSLLPETRPAGHRFLGAFAVGCEAQLRIGCAISPAHYDHGWHITGTCGVFGAAVAASALLGLDAATTARALSLAAAMTAGHREAFGTMTKPLHAGKAAANGVLAARLAAAGLSGPDDILGPGGVLEVLADQVDWEALGLNWPAGHPWELELNTIKTYPCGVVAHPAMDAAIAVSADIGDPADITGITLRCDPLVPELMGRVQPEDGLGSRFSARHGVAVGLLYGRAGLAEFSDATATAPAVARLRALIELDPDPVVPRDAATLRIRRRGAPPVEVTVEHTRGSAARPLTDDEVLDKVRALFGPVLGAGAADRAWAAIGRLSAAPDTSELLAVLRSPLASVMPESGTPIGTADTSAVSAGAQQRGEATADMGSRVRAVVDVGPDPVKSAGPTEAVNRTKTGTDEILALARHAAPTADAKSDLIEFGEAAARGDRSPVVRALAAIRPAGPPPVGDPGWTAWLTAAAAAAAGSSGSPGSSGRADNSEDAGEKIAPAAGIARPADVIRLASCAAVMALAGPRDAADDDAKANRQANAGDRAVAAVAAGVDAGALVESRLSDWGGWSGSTVAAVMGAVVAAGLTLGLTDDQARNALGIAATQAAGLRAAESTDAGPLQAGKAAFNGVEAALLAWAGLTAPAEPLDGRRGLFALFGSDGGQHV